MGLASRASSLLTSARTAQTLWLHNLSRQLANHQAQEHYLTLPLLAKLLQPKIRLAIIKMLPFGTTKIHPPLDSPFNSRHEERERKVILARCRLLRIDCKDDEPPQPTASTEQETQGVVLFSLHEHAPASTNILAASAIPPRKKAKREGDDSRTVFVPTNVHDLRFLEEGAEMWVWDPVHEVELSAGMTVGQRRGEVRDEEGFEGTQAPLMGGGSGPGDVFWDSRSKEERGKARETKERRESGDRARREWGLVCGRFAVVV